MKASCVVLVTLVMLMFAPTTAIAQVCPGCENITAPGNPTPDVFSWDDLLGIFTVGSGSVTTVVSNTPGICAFNHYGPPYNYSLCEPLTKCKSNVTITLDLVDSHPTSTMYFTISTGGTICNVGHTIGSTTIAGSGSFVAFSGLVEYICGTSCTIDTSYTISGSAYVIPFGWQPFGPSVLHVYKTLACDACARLVVW